MEFVDTHCHLFMEPLDLRSRQVLDQARIAGVKRVIVPAFDPTSWPAIAKMANYQGVFTAFGVHPWVAQHSWDRALLEDLLLETGAVAVIVCLLAIMVVFPVEVTSPVRFALVVTVAAFPVVF